MGVLENAKKWSLGTLGRTKEVWQISQRSLLE